MTWSITELLVKLSEEKIKDCSDILLNIYGIPKVNMEA